MLNVTLPVKPDRGCCKLAKRSATAMCEKTQAGLLRRSSLQKVYGRFEAPIRNLSHSRAAPRPSFIAQTTRLWPRRQSPAAKMPATLVVNWPCSALALERGSRSTPSCVNTASSGPRKPIASKTRSAFNTLIGTRDSLWDKCPLLILGPLDVVDMHLFDVAAFVADELLAGGKIHSRIGAKTGRDFFLTVVELINLRPLRPRIVGLPAVGWPRQDFQLG